MVNPGFWAQEQQVHEQLRWLRHNDPVRRLEPNGFDPFWCLTEYEDIQAVELNKATFINDPRR